MMHAVLIEPRKGKKESPVDPVVAMVAMEKDLPLVKKAAGIKDTPVTRILTSPVFQNREDRDGFAIAGPMVGAPYAVLVLEKLIALGAKKILFCGWCGSLKEHVKTGDLIIPDGAIVGEGTSPYYGDEKQVVPSHDVLDAIVRSCDVVKLKYHKGIVWSMDAPYRETTDAVMSMQERGVLAVDMEISALFTVARFRNVALGAILTVSDELASLRWKPGYATDAFRKARTDAAEIVTGTCKRLKRWES